MKSIAYHEAGHAVAYAALGFVVVDAKLMHNRGVVNHADPVHDVSLEATALMAGPLAEARYARRSFKKTFMEGGCADMEKAQALLGQLVSVDRAMYELWHEHMKRTRKLLSDHWPAVRQIAELLLQKRRVSGSRVHSIVSASKVAHMTATKEKASQFLRLLQRKLT